MMAVGNDELENAEPIDDTIKCGLCGGEHKVENGNKILEDGSVVPSNAVSFYKCGDKSFLCGIKGKRIHPRGSQDHE